MKIIVYEKVLGAILCVKARTDRHADAHIQIYIGYVSMYIPTTAIRANIWINIKCLCKSINFSNMLTKG